MTQPVHGRASAGGSQPARIGGSSAARPVKRPALGGAQQWVAPVGGGASSPAVDLTAGGDSEELRRKRRRQAAMAAAVAAQASLAEQLQEANNETGLRLVRAEDGVRVRDAFDVQGWPAAGAACNNRSAQHPLLPARPLPGQIEPPPHWEVTPRLLRGETQLTPLPLPGGGQPAEELGADCCRHRRLFGLGERGAARQERTGSAAAGAPADPTRRLAGKHALAELTATTYPSLSTAPARLATPAARAFTTAWPTPAAPCAPASTLPPPHPTQTSALAGCGALTHWAAQPEQGQPALMHCRLPLPLAPPPEQPVLTSACLRCSFSRMPKHDAGSVAANVYGGRSSYQRAWGATPLPTPPTAVFPTARPRYRADCVAMLLVQQRAVGWVQPRWIWSAQCGAGRFQAPPRLNLAPPAHTPVRRGAGQVGHGAAANDEAAARLPLRQRRRRHLCSVRPPGGRGWGWWGAGRAMLLRQAARLAFKPSPSACPAVQPG